MTGEYVINKRPHQTSLTGFPYEVTGPDGRFIDLAATLWGAKRIIRRHRARLYEPVEVHREAP